MQTGKTLKENRHLPKIPKPNAISQFDKTKSAKQLNIFVQEVLTTSNILVAKFKSNCKYKYLNKAKNAREQFMKY